MSDEISNDQQGSDTATTCLTCGHEVRGGFHQGEMCREIAGLRERVNAISDLTRDLEAKRIVTWLRCKAIARSSSRKHGTVCYSVLRELADGIERGDHHA